MLPSLYERMRKADRRRDARFATSFKATLVLDSGSRSVVVGDISAGGAMLQADMDLWPGRQLSLKAIDLDVNGEIRWRNDRLCGVAFSVPVDPFAIIAANAREGTDSVLEKPRSSSGRPDEA
ncbi:PilZ domain-containing protein [Sphingobium sp. AP50]|nr:PilZ domain-containing protein [Sphingobium sp. AP50]